MFSIVNIINILKINLYTQGIYFITEKQIKHSTLKFCLDDHVRLSHKMVEIFNRISC